MRNKNVINKVKEILCQYPQSQDNDNDLLARIWYSEFMSNGMNQSQAIEICMLLKNGKLSHPQSIRRTRQKIQEEHPNLRGSTYQERQKKQIKLEKKLSDYEVIYSNNSGSYIVQCVTQSN